ncbi:MAG: hypothetical protein JKY43_08735 [Phycisphaerales bacterium]|nr:hypothetical protein [Phycisphaerales bacterium]
MAPIELTNDTIRVVIDPSNGCRIDALELPNPDGQWQPVLRSGADGVGSFLMVPWTNRIKGAKFGFDNQTHRLRPNHPDGSAIHGVGRDHGWMIGDRSPYTARCVFDSRLVERVNFPFAFGAVFRIEIGDGCVEIDLELTNLGDSPMPGGVGHHPYFLRSLWDQGDELRVKAGVGGRYPCEDQIPVGPMVDDEVCKGLRAGGAIGDPGLDDVFGGFDGRAVLEWDKSGVRCVMECCDVFGHLVMYTPGDDTAPLPWVCVEPVSMVNDGFNRMTDRADTGVRILEPGETLKSSMTLRFERI